MKIESFSIGSKHYINEDRLVVRDMGLLGIIAVLADGMGGLSLGDKAADVVAQSASDFIATNYLGQDEGSILHDALGYADKCLRAVSIANKSNMGAAVAIAIVSSQRLYCTWQGNVRIYVRHDDRVRLITKDHIADIGYGRTALTRCIKGGGLREDVPFIESVLETGDDIYLCTDGLYNVVENTLFNSSIEDIQAIIGTPEDDASLIKVSINHAN